MKRIFVLVAILALAMGCAKKEEGVTPTGGTITGKVTLEGEKDFSGVTVSIDVLGMSTTTKADGSFVLSDIPAGSFPVSFSKEGWATVTQDVIVDVGKTATVSVTLPKLLTVKGVVVVDGEGVGGITVKIQEPNLSSKTRNDGSFEIPNVPPGSYTLLVIGSEAGYGDATIPVEVVAGEPLDVGEIPLPKQKPYELAIWVPTGDSTGFSWMTEGSVNKAADYIMANVKTAKTKKAFKGDAAGLAKWMQERMKDGKSDVVVLLDTTPKEIYPAQNTQPDGSIAEEWLLNGNTIIYTGDYSFFVAQNVPLPRVENSVGGAQNILNEPNYLEWPHGQAGWSDGSDRVFPTPDGKKYTPTLQPYDEWRATQLDRLTKWKLAVSFADEAGGGGKWLGCGFIKLPDVKGAYFGRFMIVPASEGGDSLPRGEVITEALDNWFAKVAER
jgi:hypothetical protein